MCRFPKRGIGWAGEDRRTPLSGLFGTPNLGLRDTMRHAAQQQRHARFVGITLACGACLCVKESMLGDLLSLRCKWWQRLKGF